MRTIIAGNWKMNKDRASASALLDALVGADTGVVEVIIAPPFPFLDLAVELVRGPGMHVAAQNCHELEHGAFTGEVSAPMLASIGVSHCIVGHSERRQYFGETDDRIARKVAVLLKHGLTPIFCCGEEQADRLAGRHEEVVAGQVKSALGQLAPDELERVVIAYEPVWAIGTGLNATAGQAQDMHAHIRKLVQQLAPGSGAAVPILYGGSCKPDNAAELFARPDVNGGLIGGASLVADQFLALIALARAAKA